MSKVLRSVLTLGALNILVIVTFIASQAAVRGCAWLAHIGSKCWIRKQENCDRAAHTQCTVLAELSPQLMSGNWGNRLLSILGPAALVSN